jgi:hypothetical protein
MRNFIKVLSILLVILLLSCSRIEGDFAIRSSIDDSYRKVPLNFEISSQDEVHWAAVFRKIKKRTYIGVTVLTRNLSWVDVYSYRDYIDTDKPAIHGIISDLPPGDYKMMIFDLKDNHVILAQEFLVY